jgi:hypothetical protein
VIYPKDQNWRTSLTPFALSLANAVSTGVSFDTPSGTIANQKRFASAGFRGFGPVHTFPGGAGMDGMGSGCGCGGCNGGGSQILLYALAGIGIYFLVEELMRHSRSYGD